MVFVNGMGLRIVEEQRAQLRKIAQKAYIHLYGYESDNDICQPRLSSSIRNKEIYRRRQQKNYHQPVNYVRKYI